MSPRLCCKNVSSPVWCIRLGFPEWWGCVPSLCWWVASFPFPAPQVPFHQSLVAPERKAYSPNVFICLLLVKICGRWATEGLLVGLADLLAGTTVQWRGRPLATCQQREKAPVWVCGCVGGSYTGAFLSPEQGRFAIRCARSSHRRLVPSSRGCPCSHSVFDKGVLFVFHEGGRRTAVCPTG